MNTSFTPGPWFIGNVEREGTPPDEIHSVAHHQDGESFLCETGGNYANALLIAAAPELLHSLREVLKWSDEWSIPEEVLTDAYAALKKATQPTP
jgi:hypothetical protein